MAVLNLTGGGEFALGAQADKVKILAEATAFNYQIYTLGNNDLIDFRLGNAANFHDAYAGAGNDTVQGGAAVETYADQAGNDLVILRGGDDYVYAGAGNDTLSGGAGNDWLYFSYLYNSVEGYEVYSGGVTLDLAKTTVQNLGGMGKDKLLGFENVFGSYGNDKISGTAGNNHFQTATGNDTLIGRAGRDFLVAEAGADVLNGGMGWDTMLLGEDAQRDLVKYSSIKESGTNDVMMLVEADNVIQFQASGAGFDRFDFKAIDARAGTAANEAFVFRGTGAFQSKGGEIRIVESGADSIIYLDNDADAAAEMVIFVTGSVGLTVDNFIL